MAEVLVKEGNEFVPYDAIQHNNVDPVLLTFAAEIEDQFKFMPSELQFRISVESEFTQHINVRLSLTGLKWTNRVLSLAAINGTYDGSPLSHVTTRQLLAEAAPSEYMKEV